MMPSSEWFGETHKLTVISVRLPDPTDQFDDGELEYEIEHPSSCPKETFGFDGHTWEDWNCDIAWHIREGGLISNLRYSGSLITEPGEYKIQVWGRKDYIWDYGTYEYDGAISLVDND